MNDMQILPSSGVRPLVTFTALLAAAALTSAAQAQQGTLPLARVAVASFECKASRYCTYELGRGFGDALITALLDHGRFDVLESAGGTGALNAELNVSGQQASFEGADLILVGAITAFEPDAGGTSGGGIGFGIPGWGSVRVGTKDAYVALDLRIIDVKTRRILASKKVEGRASSFNVGAYGGFMGFAGSLGTYKNTPMEQAIAVLLRQATDAVANSIPASYFRH